MTAIATKIVEAMLGEITRYGLELMQRYPKDLLDVDHFTLSRHALPGAKFGWCVGHSHTHLAILGIHPKRNEILTCFTNLCNDDRFYLLEVDRNGETFSLKEVERKAFPDLARTRIPYKRVGKPSAFWLYNGDVRVGTCRLDFAGHKGGTPTYTATLQVMAGTRERDLVALEAWAAESVIETAGTLFSRTQYVWEDPMQLLHAA